MTDLERENAEYCRRIDEIAGRFQREKTYYAKEWLEKLTAPVEGAVPSDTVRRDAIPPVCIWGAGEYGKDFYNLFLKRAGVPISWYCDNASEKWGSEVVDSIRCISPQELQNIPDCRVIVAVNGYQEEISNQCLKMNIPQNHIFCAPLSLFIWRAKVET